MKGLVFVFGLVALAVALFATKPSQSDAVDLVREEIRGEILSMSQEDFTDPDAALIAAACTAFSTACANLISLTFPMTYEDRVLFAQITLAEGTAEETRCIGALNQIMCQSLQ